MKKTRHFFILAFAFSLLWGCTNKAEQSSEQTAAVNIIPRPMQTETGEGSFSLSKNTKIVAQTGNPELLKVATYLAGWLNRPTNFGLKASQADQAPENGIFLTTNNADQTLGQEGYQLSVKKQGVVLRANTPTGAFRGVQSILQLLPPAAFSAKKTNPETGWQMPCVKIKDKPRYSYRGMHLDVSRHFFPKEFIKKYIDLIAMFKMNTFHWHLVDDQGWRIEIKQYPKLTEIGAWRIDREDQPWNERDDPTPGEKATYGGFYTQDEVREIVAYAQERHITIIPEIEMPAHVSSALAAYPQFSCTGNIQHVPPGGVWPITDIYCAGNDSTFIFLENILTEVIDLFPGKYIHIGGDEAHKAEWEKCPKCQARIRAEGLQDEKQLQSYFIKRIEKFLLSKGRYLIGWDEILEGGLAPQATVMSWRGIKGGIEAAQQGHDVIMTPGTHCYFDHYQGDPATEPKAIGGYTTLKKVYHFNPTPDELSEKEAQHILGAQANLWTEYIHTPEHAEYMVLPRMAALAEVVWTPEEKRDWQDFNLRLPFLFERLEAMPANYCVGTFKIEISTTINQESNTAKIVLENELFDKKIHYTLDGSQPTAESPVYTEPIEVKKTTTVKAVVEKQGKLSESIAEKTVYLHKGLGKKITYLQPYNQRYDGGGDKALLNGMQGSLAANDGHWQGFDGKNLEVVIDLGEETEITGFEVGFLHYPRMWIFLPEKTEFLLSQKGEDFQLIATVENQTDLKEAGALHKVFAAEIAPVKARFVKVVAHSIGTCPAWHSGAGQAAWLFADEIAIK